MLSAMPDADPRAPYLPAAPELAAEPDTAALIGRIDAETSCVVVQYPDILGRIGDLSALADAVHAAGALLVAVVTEPVALGAIRSPGAMGLVQSMISLPERLPAAASVSRTALKGTARTTMLLRATASATRAAAALAPAASTSAATFSLPGWREAKVTIWPRPAQL